MVSASRETTNNEAEPVLNNVARFLCSDLLRLFSGFAPIGKPMLDSSLLTPFFWFHTLFDASQLKKSLKCIDVHSPSERADEGSLSRRCRSAGELQGGWIAILLSIWRDALLQ